MKLLYTTLLFLNCVSAPMSLELISTPSVLHNVFTAYDIDPTAQLEMSAREGLCQGNDDCYDRFPLTHYTLQAVADAYWKGQVILNEGPFRNSGL